MDDGGDIAAQMRDDFKQFLVDLREVFRQELSGSSGLSSGSKELLEPLGIRSRDQLQSTAASAQMADDIRRIRDAVDSILELQQAASQR